ncbi:MAG: hypothetical protein CMG62_10790 [Candidatus Marinimicrobia bacterium]|nr:hypothetical protein [Candidatus Neomarinimicrobiota bacterium]|tara:strand:+ start:542 stop:1471 length:930 start_codon:yes stop_codon:yes gene_type:complete
MRNQEEEIDYLNLKYLINLLIKSKKSLFLSFISFSLLSIFYSLSLDNIYKSNSKLKPVSNIENSQSTFGGISGFASGLGLNLNQSSDRTSYAIEILKSTDFFKELYKNESFLLELEAIEHYDIDEDIITLNEDIYDIQKEEWILDTESLTKTKKPSLMKAKNKFYSEHLSISVDLETRFITISISHVSPKIAQKWLNETVEGLNKYVQKIEIQEVEHSITYLKEQISLSKNSEVKAALANILQKQLEILMLSEVNQGYIVKFIDSPSLPEMKSYPIRSKMVISITLMGLVLTFLAILILDLNKRRNLLK